MCRFANADETKVFHLRRWEHDARLVNVLLLWTGWNAGVSIWVLLFFRYAKGALEKFAGGGVHLVGQMREMLFFAG